MISFKNGKLGFTLIELVITIGLFSLLATMMYGTFNAVQKQVSKISVDSSLSDKGQRILSFIEEDIRMIGALLGPDARVPYCTGGVVPATSNVIQFTQGTKGYDTLTFLTTRPLMLNDSPATCMTGQTDSGGNARIDYYLTTRGESAAGTSSIDLDAALKDGSDTCSDDVAFGTSENNNGRSLITFDSLLLSAAAVAESAPQVYYTLNMPGSPGSPITLYQTLQQNIPDNSTFYAIRQYQYLVPDTTPTSGISTRTLRRAGWNKSCTQSGGVVVDLIETSNVAGTTGGVDGLKFEFTYIDTLTNQLITQATLPPLSQLKSITVWLLLRSDKVDSDYTNTTSYVLGKVASLSNTITVNDHYRRTLMSKTVEVKNLASIN
jgi:prepilin-type N-terminal cleavage/methylation domain-containing protein